MSELSPDRKGPIAWMATHTVAPNLLMLVLILGGAFMLYGIQKEVFPETNMDIVSVSVPYPGASPEEVEQSIVLAIEENVYGLEGVKEVISVAQEGIGIVNVEMIVGGDLQRLAQDIKTEYDRIRTIPLDAEEPIIEIVSRKRSVLELQIYGDVSETALRVLAERARDQLLLRPDISQVELQGARPFEISVEVPQANLRRYDLRLDDIATRLRRASVEIPGGGIKTSQGETLVRVKERRDFGHEFEKLPIIIRSDGTEVLLGDIAEIKDGFAEDDRYALYNGMPSIGLTVYRIGAQTPVAVSSAAKEVVADLNDTLPGGVQIAISNDMAEVYDQRVNLLLKNGATGLLLVLIALGLFLEIRLAFWVMMGIPISFMGSMIFLSMMGVSINLVTMFAYLIALGIVVDDAIVIGENIYYYHERGLRFIEAAVKGARELAGPVVFSILTNVAAFMPLYFVPGDMGKIFKFIPVVVIIVFLISLVESLFILPAHLGHHRERKRHGLNKVVHTLQQSFSKGFTSTVNAIYGPLLGFLLRWRYAVVAAAFAGLIITLSWPMSGRMGFSMFPVIESDFSRADITLPYGSPVAKTDVIVARLQEGARKVAAETGHPELIEGIFSVIGATGSHVASVQVFLAAPEIRNKIMGTEAFTEKWRAAVGHVEGIENLIFAADAGGPGRGAALTVELTHPDIGVLEQATTILAEQIADYENVKDIKDGFQPGKQQIDFKLKPVGKALGLTAVDVAAQVRGAFYGSEVVRQQRGRNEVKVMVRWPKSDRISEQNLEDFMLRTPAGREVPLREVVEADRGRAYTSIARRNGRRVVQLEANVVPRSAANEYIAALESNELPALKQQFPGLQYSFEGSQADQRESMGGLMGGFVIAMIVVFALLAIPFGSYTQPLIVMTSIPFGIIGAILGHLIMGYSLSVLSVFGIVALSGVVVNDSLVLIDAANRRLRDGSIPWDAVHAAALQRFRPIMLTTLTTFCGLAPMIMETSRQARFLIPMAISLGFGIVFATLITLAIVPCLYLMLDDFHERIAALRRFMRNEEKESVEA